MPTAKFYTIGDINQWFRLRIHEEIYTNNLEGSVLDTGENKLAVIVEGSIGQIKSTYNRLNESKPENIVLTSLVFGNFERPRTSISKADLSRNLLDVMKEIEKKLRRIEQKLDAISARTSAGITSERTDADLTTTSSSGDVNPFEAFFDDQQ